MMTATAYPSAMTDLRGEPSHSSFWSNYNGSAHMSNRLGTAGMDSGFQGSSSASPLPGRPRSSHDQTYSYGRYSQEESGAFDRHAQTSLATPQSYPSLKRPFSQTEPAAYQEIVQDLRDDGSRLTANQDHKLLSFRRAQDKTTIVDQQGRMQQLELSAQLHGMFFLSEMPSTSTEGNSLQPELTCYRRNLFQISGSLITPRGQLSVVNESNETVPVSTMEIAISAIESVDGNPVRLVVIPWKTPPPNAPELSQSADQEPSPLPLIPFQDDGSEPDGEYAVYPIGWRRLQFRIATANNGRRKELQQHFVLHLKVHATLADNSKVVLTECTTAPIVVRGRSPRNFQARKEIPLLGSSAGSRGQALVETGLGVVAGPLSVKPQELKRSNDIQVPRSNFTFSPPKVPGNQISSMRSNTFPTWSTGGNNSMSSVPSSSPGGYPSSTMGSDSYSKVPITNTSNYTSEPQEVPLQAPVSSVPLPLSTNDQTPAGRGQYTYLQSTSGSQLPTGTPAIGGQENNLSIPRYVDNGRPTKASRHAGQQSVHTPSLLSTESPEYRYGSSTQTPVPAREYYPSSSSWATTAAGENSSSAAYTNSDSRPYSFPHEPYKTTPTSVKPENRGQFEPMNSYSWNGN